MWVGLFKISDFQFKKAKNKNRDSLEIVRDMLSVATEKTKKTRILYDAHLNHRLLEKYLNFLIQNELIERVDNSWYLITRKGKNFLQNYKEYSKRCRRIGQEIKYVQKEKMILTNMCFKNLCQESQ